MNNKSLILFISIVTSLTLLAVPALAGPRTRLVRRKVDSSRLVRTGTKLYRKMIVCFTKNNQKKIPGILRKTTWIHWKKAFKKRIERKKSKGSKKVVKKMRKRLRKTCNTSQPPFDPETGPPPITVPDNPDPGNTIFVDLQLSPASGGSGDCTADYDPAQRSCAPGSGTFGAFDTFQEAADVVDPGDYVLIRGGTYQDVTGNCRGSGYCEIMYLKRSGTADAPVTFINYQGEKVILKGFGFEDRDLDNDGLADGPPGPIGGVSIDRENLVIIEADYIQASGLELSDSTSGGLSIRGSNNLVENCSVHDNWATGVALGYQTSENKIVEGNILRYLETYRNRHGNGISLGRSGPGSRDTYLNYTRNNRIEYCLSYHNGYRPNGEKVLPIQGDPAGGGNSDALGSFKICHDAATATVPNWCPNNTLRYNIGFHNADDGMDLSMADSLIEGNIMFDNGPEGNKGYKVLRQVYNLTYRGNIAVDNYDMGFEPRVEPGEKHYFYNNTAIRNGRRGLSLSGDGVVGSNNLSVNNSAADYMSCSECTNNVISGDPNLTDINFVIDTNLPANYTIAQKLAFIRDQFKQALTPASASSPLVDQGGIIDGYHCPTTGAHPDQNCREWYGAAPDIGAFEYQ